jgi:hypothetical protein
MFNHISFIKKIMEKCKPCLNKLTWLISLAMIVACLLFLYDNFYKAVNDARVLTTIKSQVALEVVDMELWDKINKEFEWKKQPLAEKEIINNPFEEQPTAAE